MKECSGVERGKVSLKGSFATVAMVAAFIVKIKNPEMICSKQNLINPFIKYVVGCLLPYYHFLGMKMQSFCYFVSVLEHQF